MARQRAPRLGSVPPPARGHVSTIGSHAELGVAYRKSEELHRDLLLVADTLREANASNAGKAGARPRRAGPCPWPVHRRARDSARPRRTRWPRRRWLAGGGDETPGAARLLAALRKLAEAQGQYGERAARTLILSMTQRAEDILAALTLARAAGLYDIDKHAVTIDIVPLFETHDALVSAPAILRTLLAHPEYRRHLAARSAQEVMVGYSDSGKEVGLLAAAFALRKAQAELHEDRARGGHRAPGVPRSRRSVARGGGPAQQAILALPAGSVAGRYRATQQGRGARPQICAPRARPGRHSSSWSAAPCCIPSAPRSDRPTRTNVVMQRPSRSWPRRDGASIARSSGSTLVSSFFHHGDPGRRDRAPADWLTPEERKRRPRSAPLGLFLGLRLDADAYPARAGMASAARSTPSPGARAARSCSSK